VAGEAGIAVALDRRVWCHVVPSPGEFRFENKASLRRLSYATVEEAAEAAPEEEAVGLWRSLGGPAGVSLTLGLPAGAALGLAVVEALAVALAAAIERLPPDEGSPRAFRPGLGEAGRGGRRLRQACLEASRQGGVVAVPRAPGASPVRLRTDPARVEESLLLVELPAWTPAAPAPGGSGAGGRTGARTAAEAVERLGRALREGRYHEVGELMAREWDVARGLRPDDVLEPLARAARAHGGAARRLAAGGTGALVWVGPGGRAAVLASVRAAGGRCLPARLDLRGLAAERGSREGL
jgi:hypothetical protein